MHIQSMLTNTKIEGETCFGYTLVHKVQPCVMQCNPRHACARVMVVVLCVCLCVYPSVPALAASASVETSKQRYSRVSLSILLGGFSKNLSVQKLWREKAIS